MIKFIFKILLCSRKQLNANTNSASRGVAILDVLFAITFLGIFLAAYTNSSITASKTVDSGARYLSSLNIAQETLESLLQVNPLTLDDTDDLSDEVIEGGITYTRVVNVTINANLSRTLEVTVSSKNVSRSSTVNLTHTTSLWGAA